MQTNHWLVHSPSDVCVCVSSGDSWARDKPPPDRMDPISSAGFTDTAPSPNTDEQMETFAREHFVYINTRAHAASPAAAAFAADSPLGL